MRSAERSGRCHAALTSSAGSTAFTFSQLQAELDSLNKDRKVRLTVIVVARPLKRPTGAG